MTHGSTISVGRLIWEKNQGELLADNKLAISSKILQCNNDEFNKFWPNWIKNVTKLLWSKKIWRKLISIENVGVWSVSESDLETCNTVDRPVTTTGR